MSEAYVQERAHKVLDLLLPEDREVLELHIAAVARRSKEAGYAAAKRRGDIEGYLAGLVFGVICASALGFTLAVVSSIFADVNLEKARSYDTLKGKCIERVLHE